MAAAMAETDPGVEKRVSFDDFIRLLEQAGPPGPLEGPDPKVMRKNILLDSERSCRCPTGVTMVVMSLRPFMADTPSLPSLLTMKMHEARTPKRYYQRKKATRLPLQSVSLPQ